MKEIFYVKKIYAKTYACNTCEKETDEANLVRAEAPAPVVKRGREQKTACFIVGELLLTLFKLSHTWKCCIAGLCRHFQKYGVSTTFETRPKNHPPVANVGICQRYCSKDANGAL